MRFKNKFTHLKKKERKKKQNKTKKTTENNQNTADFYRVRGEMFYNVHHSQIRQSKKTKGLHFFTHTHIETSRAANFDLCSVPTAIEQKGFFSVPHQL